MCRRVNILYTNNPLVYVSTFARVIRRRCLNVRRSNDVPEIPSFPTERPRVDPHLHLLSTNDAHVQRKFNSNKLCINGGSEVQIPFFNIPVVIFIVASVFPRPDGWING